MTWRNDVVVNGRAGGCLFVEDDIAPKLPVKDNAKGNTRGGYSYSDNYHKYTYGGKTYRMFSAWQFTNTVKCPKDISKCVETNAGTQKRHLIRTLKMLVYKYLKCYENNLVQVLNRNPDNLKCHKDLVQLRDDLNLVENLTDESKYVGKPFYIDLSGNNTYCEVSDDNNLLFKMPNDLIISLNSKGVFLPERLKQEAGIS